MILLTFLLFAACSAAMAWGLDRTRGDWGSKKIFLVALNAILIVASLGMFIAAVRGDL